MGLDKIRSRIDVEIDRQAFSAARRTGPGHPQLEAAQRLAQILLFPRRLHVLRLLLAGPAMYVNIGFNRLIQKQASIRTDWV